MIRNIWHKIFRRKAIKSSLDVRLEGFLLSILNEKPKDLSLYRQAFSHSSVEKTVYTNGERLEFLGDAILGAVVAAELHILYPNKSEGHLSTMRSKIVSRKQLNTIGKQLKLESYIIASEQAFQSKSIVGNTLESVIGAIYLDLGWSKSYDFILNQIFPRVNLRKLVNSINSYKSYALEWAQKNKQVIEFKTISESGEDHDKTYEIALYLEKNELSSAKATSKKKAEEIAAKKAYELNYFSTNQ